MLSRYGPFSVQSSTARMSSIAQTVLTRFHYRGGVTALAPPPTLVERALTSAYPPLLKPPPPSPVVQAVSAPATAKMIIRFIELCSLYCWSCWGMEGACGALGAIER